ncbi:hypothetical protein ACSVDA_16085 [Cytobacillus sp. Hm23]|uniref:hypothetical protein n=1 Tax=Bacillaceae TaxID=186817 RepID=UPI002A0C9800|nr:MULTISPECIES: hypothetical protein [unclassified Cytobacillus]MDX8366487.1 hypothetical protein [Cytobacillus sp. IB215665]
MKLTRNNDNFINIKFQDGAIDKNGINGCQVEDVLPILINKLKAFQNGDFHSMENSLAISNLEAANYALHCRRERVELEKH